MNKFVSAFERVSLRAKLTALSIALIGVLLGVTSLGTVAVLRTYLQQSQDTVLTAAAQSLSTENAVDIRPRMALGLVDLPNLPTDYFIAFVDNEGTINLSLSSSTNPRPDVLNVSSLNLPTVVSTRGLPFEIDRSGKLSRDNDGPGWRIIALPLRDMSGSVVVALPTGTNNGVISQYRNIGLAFSVMLLLLSGVAVFWTITRSLRPLKEVERTAAAVAAGDISKRLMEHEGTTEIARINRSLNTMLSSIEGAMGERGRALDQMRRFIADASHELRTPLVAVRGYAELYRMGALKDKAKLDDAMERIESEAIRMSGLVENLLALARLEEHQKLEKTKIDFLQVCLDAIKDAAAANPNLKFKLVTLGGENYAGEPLQLNAELNSIKQILVNLLSNASRFAGKDNNVELAVGQDGANTVFEVRDHGEGIPVELRTKVFERFYRADNSRNRETGGNGLGLAIVKAMVEAHGGTIEALETPGGGATFRVAIPNS